MTNHDIAFKRLASDTESLQQLRELNIVFAEAFDEKETYLGHKPSDDYLLSLLNKDQCMVCVAHAGKQVVAGLVAYVLEKFEQERNEVYIYGLAVAENYRRQRIATDLILFLRKEALKRDAWIIFVQAEKGDIPAMKLYESLGIREEAYHYDLKMEDT